MNSKQLFAVFVAVALIFTGGATATGAPITSADAGTSGNSDSTTNADVSPMMDVPCPAMDYPVGPGGGDDDDSGGGC